MYALIAVFENGSEKRICGFTREASAIQWNDGYDGALRVEIRKEG